ncbi:TetR/AcrR family transcriptional regulator [Asanoa sp. NPDC049573]|uniref:TetR/AcrR family transcriptional regulator n=1 Tax=Asanoa sp. NPDC049573 TaxID=3155396 RepID=UPI00342F40DF
MPKVSDAHLTARRRQILDAAGRCFARDGFHRTSMQDIVHESGISAGLVYRYFAGKDEMIIAIVNQWHERRQALIEAGQHATGDANESRDLVAEAYLDLVRSIGQPQALEDLRLGVQVWAEAVRTPAIRELVRRGVDGPRTTAANLISRAQGNSAVPADLDPDALARILIAIYQGLVLQTVWDESVDNDALVATLEAILDMIIPS